MKLINKVTAGNTYTSVELQAYPNSLILFFDYTVLSAVWKYHFGILGLSQTFAKKRNTQILLC